MWSKSGSGIRLAFASLLGIVSGMMAVGIIIAIVAFTLIGLASAIIH